MINKKISKRKHYHAELKNGKLVYTEFKNSKIKNCDTGKIYPIGEWLEKFGKKKNKNFLLLKGKQTKLLKKSEVKEIFSNV